MAPPLKLVDSLEQMSVSTIADNFETFMIPYNDDWVEVITHERPTFGPFGNLKSSILLLIIEEFIRREELPYEYLLVLLPEDAETLTCDVNTSFTPFSCKVIDLISLRCPDFKSLHCHYDLMMPSAVSNVNRTLTDSIPRLKLLQEINFCDTWIIRTTIMIISLNCPHLKVLNLQRTNLSENDVFSLSDEDSVLKNSLTKLIIDETYITTESVEKCLLNLRNVTHFQSDSTIDAALEIFKRVRNSKRFQKFQTTTCKNKFLETEMNYLTEDFLNWLVKKFPDVNHLNISLNEAYVWFGDILIKSFKHITQLELSSWCEGESISFLIPSIQSCKNLITLKLENFVYVNVRPLGNSLKKLEKLTLVNNTYVQNEVQFKSLKEFQLILFEEHFKHESLLLYSDHAPMPCELLSSILSSEKIEKVLLYGQSNFLNSLVEDLFVRGCLQNLKEIKVFKCLLGIDGIWELLNKGIKITDIVVGFCDISEEDVNQTSSYCKENNLATSITMVSENPYYLRWLVQETEVPP